MLAAYQLAQNAIDGPGENLVSDIYVPHFTAFNLTEYRNICWLFVYIGYNKSKDQVRNRKLEFKLWDVRN